MKRFVAGMVLSMLVLAAGCSTEKVDPPTESGSRTATVVAPDGVDIEYQVQGEGPVALVFIHGWICDRTHWRHQIETFSEGHTVVTLDLAGHGNSGTGRASWTVESFGADVEAVVGALDLSSVILVGHSMGGQVALDAAARMPERVLGVVGVDTLHNVEQAAGGSRYDDLMTRYELDFAGTCGEFIEYMFPRETEDPGLPDWVEGNMCDADAEIAVAVGRHLPTLDQPAMLAAVDVPVRCINSSQTAKTDIEANRRHGDYDALLMDDVGHFVMLERPREFNRLLLEVIEELTGS